MSKGILEEVEKILRDCEDVQSDRGESNYRKEREKISAYDKIKELFL